MFFNKRRAARRVFLTIVTTLILSTSVGGLVIWALQGTTQTTAQTNPQNSTQKISRAAGAAFQVDDQAPKKGLSRQELAEEARAWHEANQQAVEADFAKGLRSLTQASVQPVGDIAVVTGDSNMITAPRSFDLNLRATSFTPANGGYVISTVSSLFDNNLGDRLDMTDPNSNPIEGTEAGDDAFVVQDLGFDFFFYDNYYPSIAISSNGNLVFRPSGVSDRDFAMGAVSSSPTLSEFQNKLPRIAPFWHDLDARPASLPNAAAGIYIRRSSDRVMITWNYIKDFPNTSADNGLHRFQVTLYANTGRITVTVDGAALTSQSLVGISPGSGVDTTVLVDLSSQRGATQYKRAPLGEFFSTTTKVDYISAVNEFYKLGYDDFDFVFFMTDFSYSIGSGDEFAFYDALRNKDLNIGLEYSDPDTSRIYGSNRLEGVLNLNSIVNVYPSLPTTRFLGSNHGLSIMAHELGHRWLSFIRYPGGDSWLGRQNAHWSFFLDTRSTMGVPGIERSSVMEGNVWEETAPESGRFESKGLVDGYSQLDQYLMGLRAANEVGNFGIIRNPSGVSQTSASNPQPGVTVSGSGDELSIYDVIQANGGERYPAPPATPLKKSLRAAVVLLVKPGTSPTTATLNKIKLYRLAFESYFNQATDGRAVIDTALVKQSRVSAISVVSSPSSLPRLAPGAQATIYGTGLRSNLFPAKSAGSIPLPLAIDETQVRVNGVIAPLFSADRGQINFQVPRSTLAKFSNVNSTTAVVEVLANNEVISAGTFQIALSAPMFWTRKFNGQEVANAVDAISGLPEPFEKKRASGLPTILAIYATGLGADATDANIASDISASLDGVKIQVGYAGPAPGFIGLNQINIYLPLDLRSGDHKLVISRNGVSSQEVIIKIR
jgi:uncharacterized protein (TIGR03437 family)